jgi:hypothetical protein
MNKSKTKNSHDKDSKEMRKTMTKILGSPYIPMHSRCKHNLVKIIRKQKVWYMIFIYANEYEEYYVCTKCGRRFQ